MKATWDYLEAGHGKGPCDGLGASVKRSADSTIKQGKATIQSSVDFYEWATQTETDTVVKYYYVSQAEYDQSEAFLKEKSEGLRPIPKTMLIHSVVPTVSPYEIAVRDTSCHCDRCLLNVKESPCLGWRFHLLKDTETDKVEDDRNRNEIEIRRIDENSHNNRNDHDQSREEIVPEVGQYVIALYEGNRYVGEVTSVDTPEKDAQINFMKEKSKTDDSYLTEERTKRKKTYFWPKPKDEIWVNFSDILFVINRPTGKRNLTLSDEDALKMDEDFE